MTNPIHRIAVVAITLASSLIATAGEPLTLWFGRPAANWEREALPLGNGRLGASIMGGVETDRIVVNEQTLWSGWPAPDNDRSDSFAALERTRQLLREGKRDEAGKTALADWVATLKVQGNQLILSGADAATVLLVAATDYKLEYPNYLGTPPAQRNLATLTALRGKSWDQLRSAHLTDFQKLFRRVTLDLAGPLTTPPMSGDSLHPVRPAAST